MNRVVLAIHGKKRDAVSCDSSHDQFTGCDENFFIGEGDIFPLFDCLVGGCQADDSDSGGDDRIRIGMSGDTLDALCAENNFGNFAFRTPFYALQSNAQFAGGSLSPHRDDLRAVAQRFVQRRA